MYARARLQTTGSPVFKKPACACHCAPPIPIHARVRGSSTLVATDFCLLHARSSEYIDGNDGFEPPKTIWIRDRNPAAKAICSPTRTRTGLCSYTFMIMLEHRMHA